MSEHTGNGQGDLRDLHPVHLHVPQNAHSNDAE
jgi:hypothetical protein